LHIQEWLQHIPPVTIYLLVSLVIGVESLGIPLPGEIVLVSASLLASRGVCDPLAVGAFAVAGAVVGDSIGYAIGRRYGKALFERLGRKFPKHFGPDHIAHAERSFQRWGMWAVFFGRFIAFLRIFAGPLAGVLRMPYWKFLTANLLGGIAWAGGTTAGVYYIGIVAENWLKNFSYLGLIAAVLIGVASFLIMRRRAKSARHEGGSDEERAAEESTSPVSG
jgi:membrane protein DedA with SNARE-associated domain